jgi:hypothetical protein
MGRRGAADRRGPVRAGPGQRGPGRTSGGRCAGHGDRQVSAAEPGAVDPAAGPGGGQPAHRAAARGAVGASGGGYGGGHRGEPAVVRQLPDADRAGPDRAAGRPVPAGPQRVAGPARGRGPAVCDADARLRRAPRDSWLRVGDAGPGRSGRIARPGGRLGRCRPAIAHPGRGAQRRAPGDRRHAARAHRPRRARAHLPGAARRGRPPHLHDRRAGRDGPAGHTGHAGGRRAAPR